MEKIKLAEGGVVPRNQVILCGDDSREEVIPAMGKHEYIAKMMQSIAYDMEMLMREMEADVNE